jgi:hypothetical protein
MFHSWEAQVKIELKKTVPLELSAATDSKFTVLSLSFPGE